MTQITEKKLTDAELDKKEYAQFEQEYDDWCKKYSITYVIEQEERDENV